MEKAPVPPLMGYFKDIKDPRIDRNKIYPLFEVIVITILAIMASAEGWEDIETQEFVGLRLNLTVFSALIPCTFELMALQITRKLADMGILSLYYAVCYLCQAFGQAFAA